MYQSKQSDEHTLPLTTFIFFSFDTFSILSVISALDEDTLTFSLLNVYENQRSDEIATLDGSITLVNAKFFDPRRYDLTRAGRYKLRKKLNASFFIKYHTKIG